MGAAKANHDDRGPAARGAGRSGGAGGAGGWSLRGLTEWLADIERDGGDPRIALVTDDSRRAVPGALFVAKPGPTRNGAEFIASAIESGAVAVLAERGVDLSSVSENVALLRADDAALALARLTDRFHHRPSERLRVIGVTGTNGKTTVSTLARGLLEASGSRCGLISTCEISAGASISKASQTTPGAAELAERLAEMVANGCAAAVIETSSHAIEQQRTAAVRYAVAVFTNLTGEHLDYHGTMERYADAKARLFESLSADAYAVLNADDPWAARMARDCPARIIACSVQGAHSALPRPVAHTATVRELGHTEEGVSLRLDGPFGAIEVDLPLVGAHNAMNALQAACAAWAAGASAEAIERGLRDAKAPPGRLEPVTRVPGVREPFTVLVDYAHTDDALERSLRAVRSLVRTGGALRVVFGCGGNRDTSKRPRMGKVASELADAVIVTSDNPRTEDPASIVAQVRTGATGGATVETIVDRAEAICRAVGVAQPGDVVLIAGKGHEDYQILSDGKGGTVTRHFDDREVARAALVDRFGSVAGVEPKCAGGAGAPGRLGGARIEGGVS